jgi:hypothetical protein
MTFPEYGLAARRKNGDVYPPTAATRVAPGTYSRSYRGSKQLQRRIFHALVAYAFQAWQFWQSSALIVFVGVISTLVLGGAHTYIYVLGFAFTVAFASIMPIVGLRDLWRVSKTYALPNVMYATIFGEETFFWHAATGTYEIAWSTVARVITRDRVRVLALRDSRAICVLPTELVTPFAEERIAQLTVSHNF